MKISYVALPFNDPTYKTRFINSIKRQTEQEYEIILFEEKMFDQNYLKESVAEATGDFVLFTDISTIINVSLSDHMITEPCNIVFSGLRNRIENRYVPTLTHERLYNDHNYLSVCQFYFSKAFLNEYIDLLTIPRYDIRPVIDLSLLKGLNVLFNDDLSLFCDVTLPKIINSFDKMIYYKIIDFISEGKLTEHSLKIFENYIDNITNIIDSDSDITQKEEPFQVLQYISGKVAGNDTLGALFSSKVGCTEAVLNNFDISGYLYCKKNNLFDLIKKYPSDSESLNSLDTDFYKCLNNHLLTQQIAEEYDKFKIAIEKLLENDIKKVVTP